MGRGRSRAGKNGQTRRLSVGGSGTGELRIIGGRFRGKKLQAPEDTAIRPTTDRIRESLFNILGHHPEWLDRAHIDQTRLGGGIEGQVVLDAFAGSGILSAECLSRGAESATLFDIKSTSLNLARANLRGLAPPGTCAFILGDVLHPPSKKPSAQPATLVFLDPPYGDGLAEDTMEALCANGWISDSALAVIESDKRDPAREVPGFEQLDRRDYGRTRLRFLRRLSDDRSKSVWL